MTSPQETRKALCDITALQNSTLLSSAEADFNESIKSLLANKIDDGAKYDPRELDPQITNYKDLFDRLKFLFLEQEAKEKFLRRILATTTSVDKSDIIDANNKIEEWKVKTQKKNDDIESLMKKLDKQCEELEMNLSTVEKYKESIKKKEDDIVEKKANLEEISEKLKNLQDETSSIVELQELISKEHPEYVADNGVADLKTIEQLERLLDETLSKLSKNQNELLSLEKQYSSKLQCITNEKNGHEKLLRQNEELTKRLNMIQSNPSPEISEDDNKLIQKEQDLKILIKAWQSISNIDNFVFDDENSLHFNFKDYSGSPVRIKFNSNTGLIEWIRCEGIPNDSISEIIIRCNRAKNPILESSQELHKSLSKSTTQ